MPPEDSSTSAPQSADPDLRDQLDALLESPDSTTALSDSHITDSSAQSAPAAHSDTRGKNPAPESGIGNTHPPASADPGAGVTAHAAASSPDSGEEAAIALVTPDNVEDLDAQLAMLTESLLSQDSAKMSPAPSPVPAAPLAPEVVSQAATAANGVPPAPSHTTPSAAPLAPSTPAPAAPPVPKPQPTPLAAAAPATSTSVKQAAAKVKEVAAPVAAKAASTIAPIGTRLLVAINKPLEGKSATVRDSLGWVGLWTIFNAICIWIFVAFFQKPPQLEVPHDAPHISSDDAESAAEHGSTTKEHAGSAADAGKDAHADTHDAPTPAHAKSPTMSSPTSSTKPTSGHGGH